MAIYCYTCRDCGNTTDLVMGMHANHPSSVPCICGGTASRDFTAEVPGIEAEWPKPIVSTSAGVNPKQIPNFIAYGNKVGARFEFDRRGRAIFRSRAHRRKCLKARGMIDQDGGYSD